MILKINKNYRFLLIDANRKPINIRTGRINSDTLIPRRGTASPENEMNPSADPERSALYTPEAPE
jgi:hypothetical protein